MIFPFKKIILTTFLVTCLCCSVVAQIGNWLQRADFGGTVRQYAVGFSINNKGYIGTGWDFGSGYKDDFWEYDPVTNSWTQKANFAGGQRIFAVGFSIGSKGYIGTGQDFGGRRKDFWEYDPVSNVWLQKANFAGTARSRAVGFEINGKGYLGTGYEDAGNVFMSDFWEYDPVMNFWNKKANFGGGNRREAVGFSIGKKGFIGTGFDGSLYKRDFWQYNPATNAWTQKANIGTPMWLAIGFAIGKKGYIGVGYGSSSPLKEFWEYDTTLNKWSRNRDFSGNARFAAVGFSIGLKGYLGTGFDINNQKMKDFWEYQPPYIVTGALSFTRYCVSSFSNNQIDVSYTKSIKFLPGNVFTAQLSDSAGSFNSPINIGYRNDTAGGIIKANIPSNVIFGGKYRIRVVSSSPAFIGSDNGINISINHNPKPAMKINDSIQCLNVNLVRFEDASFIPYGKVINSKWFFGDNDTSSGNVSIHKYKTDGNFSVRLRVQSDSGCADSVNVPVIILPVPVSAFDPGDTVQCLSYNKLNFINKSSIKKGTLSYKWFSGNGDSSLVKDYSCTYTRSGLFNPFLIAISSGGCADTSSHLVKVDSTALASFSLSDTVQCARSPVAFNNSTPGNPAFIWFFGDGGTDTLRNAVHAFAKDTVYVVKLISYTASTQCYDTFDRKIYIIPSPFPDFSVNKLVQNRIGNNFQFTNLSTVKSGTFTSDWYFYDGNSSKIKDPAHSYTSADSFNVKLVVTNDLGCKDSAMKWVYVFNTFLHADYYVHHICVGDTTFFKNTSVIKYDSLVSFEWNFGENNLTYTSKDINYRYSKTGMYTVKMKCNSLLGYTDSVSYNLNVLPSPKLDIELSPQPPYILGDIATLTAKGKFDTVIWSTGEQSQSIDVNKTATYTARIVDENGCDSVKQVFVEFLEYPGLTPPNIITPNGDGVNDVWKIEKPERYSPSELYIYNRWGEIVYKSDEGKLQWDGKHHNLTVATGTYYFVLYGNGFKMSGTISVVY